MVNNFSWSASQTQNVYFKSSFQLALASTHRLDPLVMWFTAVYLKKKLFLTQACEIFGGNICGGGICGRDGRYLTFSRLVWLLLPSLGPSTFHKNFCQIRVYLSFWSDRGKRLAIFNIQSSRCPFSLRISVSELMSRKNFCAKSQFFSNFN